MVNLYFSVSNQALPTSTVLPLALSSSYKSSMYAIHQDSFLLDLASSSYFSMVRSSTCPVISITQPHMVDLPLSTWPMNTMFAGFNLQLNSSISLFFLSNASLLDNICEKSVARSSFLSLDSCFFSVLIDESGCLLVLGLDSDSLDWVSMVVLISGSCLTSSFFSFFLIPNFRN